MYGYDAQAKNVTDIPNGANPVMGYVTGSAGIVWSAADYARFPADVEKQYIDQGNGTPWRTPTVIDVESGAHTVADIPSLVKKYGEDVIIYCMQSNLAACHEAAPNNPVWVAAPSYPTDAEAVALVEAWEKQFPGIKVWGVQNVWTSTYDRTYIVPKPVVPPKPVATPTTDTGHLDINGYNVRKPGNGYVPVVIGWWGDDGVTYRFANLPLAFWDTIPW